MTNKQIIFDDVDVKDCIAYAKLQEIYLGNTLYKQMEKVCMVKNMPCKYFDCQFKQMARELKAKEQECERLKNERTIDLVKQLDQLKAKYKEAVNDLLSIQYKLADSNTKLRQTLTEIKEIAEPYNDMSGNCVIVNCFEDMYKILQKISEVIE